MKILYLDLCAKYMNPTRSLLPRLLSDVGDVTFFGPGYTDEKLLEKGLLYFEGLKGGFDVVITNAHFIFSEADHVNDLPIGYQKNYCFHFPFYHLKYIYPLYQDFLSMGGLKVGILLESDYYNFTEDYINRICDGVDYVVAWGEQFSKEVRDLPDLPKEAFYNKVNDNWHRFVKEKRDRLIPLLHFVSDSEFFYGDIYSRKNNWAVPGAGYADRKKAKSILEKKLLISKGRMNISLTSFLTRLGVNPLSNYYYLTWFQEKFRNEIRGAKFSYTCGSALDWPIRKFFEIPALGGVLVCKPCNGFEDLGFSNGVNAISCLSSDILDVNSLLSNDLDFAQSLASSGRELVARQHSLSARASQLKLALTQILQNDWNGVVWKSGEFLAIPKEA